MKKQEVDLINNMRMEGKTASEIASVLRISVNTVRSYIRRHPDIQGRSVCRNCGKVILQPSGKKQSCSVRINAVWPGGTAIRIRSIGNHITIWSANSAGRSLLAMEINTENSVAESVISNPESPYPAEKLIRYQTALALMDSLLRDNGLSDEDHKIARALIACHYGLDSCSIFR